MHEQRLTFLLRPVLRHAHLQVIVPEKRLIVSEKAVLLDELAKELQVRSGCRLHLVVHELPAGDCRSMHTLDSHACHPPAASCSTMAAQPGDVVEGVVGAIMDWGCFVECRTGALGSH